MEKATTSSDLTPELVDVARAILLLEARKSALGVDIHNRDDVDDCVGPYLANLGNEVTTIIEDRKKYSVIARMKLNYLLVAGLNAFELLLIGSHLLIRIDQEYDRPGGVDGAKIYVLVRGAIDVFSFGVAKCGRHDHETLGRLYFNLGFALLKEGKLDAFKYREALDAFQKASALDHPEAERHVGITREALSGLGWDYQANDCDGRHRKWLKDAVKQGEVALHLARQQYGDELAAAAAVKPTTSKGDLDQLVEWLAPVTRRTCGPLLSLFNDRRLVNAVGWELVNMWVELDGFIGQSRCATLLLHKLSAKVRARVSALPDRDHPFLDVVDWKADDLSTVHWPVHKYPRAVQAVVITERRLGIETHPWVVDAGGELSSKCWDKEIGGLEGVTELQRVCREALGQEKGDQAVETTVEVFAAELAAVPDPLSSLEHLLSWLPKKAEVTMLFDTLRLVIAAGQVENLRQCLDQVARLAASNNAETLLKVFCAVFDLFLIHLDKAEVLAQIREARANLFELADPEGHPAQQLFSGPYLEDLDQFVEMYLTLLASVVELDRKDEHACVIELIDAFPTRVLPLLNQFRDTSADALKGCS